MKLLENDHRREQDYRNEGIFSQTLYSFAPVVSLHTLLTISTLPTVSSVPITSSNQKVSKVRFKVLNKTFSGKKEVKKAILFPKKPRLL